MLLMYCKDWANVSLRRRCLKGKESGKQNRARKEGRKLNTCFSSLARLYFPGGRGIPCNVLLENVLLENFFRLQATVGIYHSLVSFLKSRYVKRVQVAGHWG